MNTEVMFSSKTDQWATPQDFFDKLNEEFHFTLDPCADEFNHKCEKYYTKEDNGLKQSWQNERVFCNPPYGREIGKWVEKAYAENMIGGAYVVMLIPARTDTKWFHDYIYNKPNVEIRFIKGRLKFGNSENSAPFPSMLVIFKREPLMINVYDLIDYLAKPIGDLLETISKGCSVYEIRKFIEEIKE